MTLEMQKVKSLSNRLLLSLLVGLAIGLSLYNFLLIRLYPPTSKQVLLLTAVACLAGALIYFWLLQRWLVPTWRKQGFRQRLLLIATAILLSLYLLVAGTSVVNKTAPEVIAFLAPDQTLEINIPSAGQPPDVETTIVYFSTSAGDISFDSVDTRGWEKTDAGWQLVDPENNSFHWAGKTGPKATLVFARSPSGGLVEISWNGHSEVIDLAQGGSDRFFYNTQFPVPFYATRPVILALTLFAFIAIALPACVWIWTEREAILRAINAEIKPYPGSPRSTRKRALLKWTLIAILMLIALALRTLWLDREVFYFDEVSHLVAAKALVTGASMSSVYQRSLYIVTLPVALFIKLFGTQLWAAKLPGVIFSVLAIIPLFLILDKVNRNAAVFGCLIYATNPWLIGVARAVREYAYYPFYFYWILYAMIIVTKKVPRNFVLIRDWKQLLHLRFVLPIFGLLLAAFYAVFIDRFSTFKIIGIAYAVFILFLLSRFDWKDKTNRRFLGTGGLALLFFFSYLFRYSTKLFMGRFRHLSSSVFFSKPNSANIL